MEFGAIFSLYCLFCTGVLAADMLAILMVGVTNYHLRRGECREDGLRLLRFGAAGTALAFGMMVWVVCYFGCDFSFATRLIVIFIMGLGAGFGLGSGTYGVRLLIKRRAVRRAK